MEAAFKRRRPWLFQTGIEGWLRQRVSDGRDSYYCDIVFVPTLSSFGKVHVFLVSEINQCDS
jgi:hypothetical protein